MTPDDRRYTKSHEWVLVEGDTARIGITDHAQDALGDITFVEVPDVGATMQPGDECGVIESVKAASDIYSPVAGEVCEVNEELEGKPELINEDAYGKGWIFALKGVDATALDGLLDAAGYEATIE